MNTKIFLLENLKRTELLGKLLGSVAQKGDIILLEGDLGAGKTTLAQSIAKGIGVPDEYYVTSPSFNIFHEYPGRIPLYHMDFYRLTGEDDILDMGIDEYFYLEGLCVIEWPERAKNILPKNCLTISINTLSENEREIHCYYTNKEWEEKLATVESNL